MGCRFTRLASRLLQVTLCSRRHAPRNLCRSDDPFQHVSRRRWNFREQPSADGVLQCLYCFAELTRRVCHCTDVVQLIPIRRCQNTIVIRPHTIVCGDPHQNNNPFMDTRVGNHQTAVIGMFSALESCAETNHVWAKISPSRFNSAASCRRRWITSGDLPSAMAMRSTAMGAQPCVTGVHSGQCV